MALKKSDLYSSQTMVDRLSNPIAILQMPELDFSQTAPTTTTFSATPTNT